MSLPRCLFIAARDPVRDDRAQELLDTLLVCASFGLPTTILFQGVGLQQLLPGQLPEASERKSLSAQLESLPLFEVEHRYVVAEDLAWYGLTPEDLCLPCTPLLRHQLPALLAAHAHVLRL